MATNFAFFYLFVIVGNFPAKLGPETPEAPPNTSHDISAVPSAGMCEGHKILSEVQLSGWRGESQPTSPAREVLQSTCAPCTTCTGDQELHNFLVTNL